MQPGDPTSLSLLSRARADDQQAWNQLVELYGPLVHRWCRRSGLNDDDTADVFQETFRAVSGNLGTFAPDRSVGSFRSWLKTIVRTKTVDLYRRKNRQMTAMGGTAAQEMMANVVDPLDDDDDEAQAEDDNSMIVRRAMEVIQPEFTPQNWNAFKKVAFDGLSAVEVAEELGVSSQAVRQANYRIRRRLRLILQDLVDYD